jgi:hypothetical protein
MTNTYTISSSSKLVVISGVLIINTDSIKKDGSVFPFMSSNVFARNIFSRSIKSISLFQVDSGHFALSTSTFSECNKNFDTAIVKLNNASLIVDGTLFILNICLAIEVSQYSFTSFLKIGREVCGSGLIYAPILSK